jgi:hypothetical protein
MPEIALPIALAATLLTAMACVPRDAIGRPDPRISLVGCALAGLVLLVLTGSLDQW